MMHHPVREHTYAEKLRLALIVLAIGQITVLTGGGGVLLFVAALLFSIGLHEFGHFISAKRFGIKVEQFFIGFGPKLWSVHRGETEYGVKAIPLGGYVRIAGMNPFEDIAPEDRERVFKAKKPWKRAIVLAAGSFTHFVLGLILIAGTLMAFGELDTDHPTPTVSRVSAALDDGTPSPAVQAGIKPGDQLVAIDGNQITDWTTAQALIKERGGQPATVSIRRAGEPLDLVVQIAKRAPEKGKPEVGFIGISPTFPVVRPGPLVSIRQAGSTVGRWVVDDLVALKNLFSPSSLNRIFQQVAGREERTTQDPSSVVGLAGHAGGLAREGDYATFLYTIAAFNIFIGVANLLPLPPLDGGHLAVLAYEKITRRSVDMRKLIPLTATVISIFGALFLMLLFLDIARPIQSIPG